MEFTEFEKNIDLPHTKGSRGKIVANFTVFDSKGMRYSYSVNTSRRAFHNAVMSKKRYNLDKAVEGDFKALVYRAKVTDIKNMVCYYPGACTCGVFPEK